MLLSANPAHLDRDRDAYARWNGGSKVDHGHITC